MPTVTNQAEYEAAVAASSAEITLSAAIVALTAPTHSCKITMPSGTGLTGAVVAACTAGEVTLYFGGAHSEVFPGTGA